jgi:predicted amidohydrolase
MGVLFGIARRVCAGDATAADATAARRARVAAISFVPTKLDLAGNAKRLEAGLREAAAGGAKLAVAPEGALDGYAINPILAGEIPVERMHEVAIPIEHAMIQRFQALARELAMCIVFGFAEKIGPDVFNSAIFIDDAGVIRGKQHKMQFEEGYHSDWWFNRLGERNRAFDTPLGRCGVLICNDRWNSTLAKIPALDGAQFLVIPAFGSTSTAQDVAVLERSRETRLPVIEANVGVGLITTGEDIAAVRRAKTAVTFAEIAIPAAKPVQPAARDAVEKEFLAWRAVEMLRRYEAKQHRFGRAATPD